MTERNSTLTSIGGRLRAQGMDEDRIFYELLDHPERDGLPENEVKSIAHSVAQKPARRLFKR